MIWLAGEKDCVLRQFDFFFFFHRPFHIRALPRKRFVKISSIDGASCGCLNLFVHPLVLEVTLSEFPMILNGSLHSGADGIAAIISHFHHGLGTGHVHGCLSCFVLYI